MGLWVEEGGGRERPQVTIPSRDIQWAIQGDVIKNREKSSVRAHSLPCLARLELRTTMRLVNFATNTVSQPYDEEGVRQPFESSSEARSQKRRSIVKR